jgi:undecaprenyl phosphate N,N'-diacetylbacillosamine 1-phosphate transferase
MQDQVESGRQPPVQKRSESGFYRRYIKRPLDFILSLTAIIILAPVLLAVAALVRIKLGSPVIFKQKRVGLNERIFTIYKFRTMTDKHDKMGKLLPDGIRLTRYGRILRSTSLDELPELFNILKGDMAVVGPRPLLVQYLPYYTETERMRHDVRPGLTGLAQISGRNFLKWDARLAKDVEYVNKLSFLGDLNIILMTVSKVLRRQDISIDTSKAEGNLSEIRMEHSKKLFLL